MKIGRPEADEYAKYYDTYIGKVNGDDLITALIESGKTTAAFFASVPPHKLDHRYADGKWSIKEVLAHITDSERIFVYRALRFARADKTVLPGYDEEMYAPESNATNRSIEDLLEEYTLVRNATIAFYKGITDEMSKRAGVANGQSISVRALGYILPGHEIHHVAVVRERYL